MSVRKLQTGEVIPLRPELARADTGAGVLRAPRRDVPPPSKLNEGADLTNVVPFLRPRAADTLAPIVTLPADALAPTPANLTRDRLRMAAFLALSVALHAGIFVYYLWREPTPLASIGVEVISAEIVVGATQPAGAAPTPGENQINSQESKADPSPAETPQDKLTTTQEQFVPVAGQETAPAETETAQPQTQEPAKQTAAVAMVENPNTPEMATVTPKEIPPETSEISLLPQPEQKTETPAEPKPAAKPEAKKPEPVVKPKPVKTAARPVKDAAVASENRRVEAPTGEKASKQAKQSTYQTASSGVGIGRSDFDRNYPGTVRAHLARYKQSVGSATGTAAVTFTVGGSGTVASVRLSSSSGVAAIDQEVQAMVRRASPFPPPPGGRAQSFSIPVNFRTQ